MDPRFFHFQEYRSSVSRLLVSPERRSLEELGTSLTVDFAVRENAIDGKAL
jgi:hypothetical protein